MLKVSYPESNNLETEHREVDPTVSNCPCEAAHSSKSLHTPHQTHTCIHACMHMQAHTWAYAQNNGQIAMSCNHTFQSCTHACLTHLLTHVLCAYGSHIYAHICSHTSTLFTWIPCVYKQLSAHTCALCKQIIHVCILLSAYIHTQIIYTHPNLLAHVCSV